MVIAGIWAGKNLNKNIGYCHFRACQSYRWKEGNMDITYECAGCGLISTRAPNDPPEDWVYAEDEINGIWVISWYWLCPKCANK